MTRDLRAEDIEPGVRLADVVCPQCRKPFRLRWNDTNFFKGKLGRATLIIWDCPSGGVYRMEIRCPHCDYVEEL